MRSDSTPAPEVVPAKMCPKCGQAKTLAEFYIIKSRPGPAVPCKECRRAAAIEWAAANRERSQKRASAWYYTNRERALASCKNYRRANRDKKREADRRWRSENRARKSENDRLWKRNNPDGIRLQKAMRRANKIQAMGVCSRSQLAARWEYYGGLCWICGAPACGIDHVIALARGGSNWPVNLRPACRSCNSRKSARDWHQFAAERSRRLLTGLV